MMSANRDQKPKGYLRLERKQLVWFLLLILLPGMLLAMLFELVFGVPSAEWIEVLMAVVFVILVFFANYLLHQGLQQRVRRKLYVADLMMIVAFSLWFYAFPAFIGRDGWAPPLITGTVIGVLSILYIRPRVGREL